MKKLIFLVTVISVLIVVNFTLASDEPKGQPFKAIWEAINYLQEQIDNIELLPGPQGAPGSEGPQGEPGLPAQHGAGNIAFMHEGDPAYLLKTDGTVWVTNTTPGWGGPLFEQITGPASQLPVPVSDIVAWEYYSLIDKDGNYWYFNYRTGANVWQNYGQLPLSLFEYYNTGDDNVQSSHGLVWEAQTFTPTISHTITKVKIKTFRVGLPGTYTVSIKSTDGEGKPIGADLASGSIDGDSLTTDSNGIWYEIDLGVGTNLLAAAKYAIVARAVGPDASDRVSWRTDASSPTYGGGQSLTSVDGGSTWTLYDYDNMFEDWGI